MTSQQAQNPIIIVVLSELQSLLGNLSSLFVTPSAIPTSQRSNPSSYCELGLSERQYEPLLGPDESQCAVRCRQPEHQSDFGP